MSTFNSPKLRKIQIHMSYGLIRTTTVTVAVAVVVSVVVEVWVVAAVVEETAVAHVVAPTESSITTHTVIVPTLAMSVK